MSLTLYYHPLASYCHKVLIALYEHGTYFERRIIDLGNEAERAELAVFWPLVKFPVIRDHARSRTVPETSIIIEYLDQHFAGEGRLVPIDAQAALEVRLWDRLFDNHVQGPMQEIVANSFRAVQRDMGRERGALATAYNMIDAHMAGRTWAGGDEFSMADCAAAPALFYAMTLVPFGPQCVQLHAYFERLMVRPSVRRVMDEAKPYFAMYPFADAIPARFR
ncbi:MAG: glutathione S-transferase family protein [Pseudomonadota bacterium]